MNFSGGAMILNELAFDTEKGEPNKIQGIGIANRHFWQSAAHYE